MDGPGLVMRIEVRQQKTDGTRYGLNVESKRKWFKGTALQNRNEVTDVENKITVAKGDRSGGINWKIEIDIHMHCLVCIWKSTANEKLLDSAENATQSLR